MPSNHPSRGQLIRRGLYDDLYSFAELEKRIGELGSENSKIVGDALEVFGGAVLAAFPHTVPTSGTNNQALQLDVCSPAPIPRVSGTESGAWTLVRIPLGPCPSLHRLRGSHRLGS